MVCCILTPDREEMMCIVARVLEEDRVFRDVTTARPRHGGISPIKYLELLG